MIQNLEENIKKQYLKAKDLGTLIFTESTLQKIREKDIDLQLSYVPLLKKKKNIKTLGESSFVDPFNPPEPSLYVQDIGNKYFIVLNKFPIIPEHFLLVTKDFEKQTENLIMDDIAMIWECLDSMKSKHMAFYNCGPQSGASQLHKHIQFISLEDNIISMLYPDEILTNVPDSVEIPWSHPKIPFVHYIFQIISSPSPEDLINMFSKLLSFTIKSISALEITEISYNFAMTKQWMFMAPRIVESWNHISINTTGMVGMFLVKSEKELNLVMDTGILEILKQLGIEKKCEDV